MIWFRVDATAFSHPKILRLRRRLNISQVEAQGVVAGLWAATARFWDDGNLGSARIDRGYIADAIGYEGDPDLLWTALVDARLIDDDGVDASIHDWTEHNGHAAGDRERKRASRAKARASCPGASADVHGQARTTEDSPGESEDVQGSPAYKQTNKRTSQTKQASKHPEAGWPACWLLCDADQKIGAEDRTLVERAFAHAGGKDVQPETVRKVVEQFDRDSAFARKAVAGLLARSASKPVANFGAYLDSAVTTEIQARNAALEVEAHQARQREAETALRDGRSTAIDPVAVAKRHEGLWAVGARPKTWEVCTCAACERGRAVPV